MNRRSAQSGFSLLELLIGVSLFLVVMGTIAMTLDSNRRSYVHGEAKIDLQQNARLALGTMATEIRMAGYFPENLATTPADPPLVNAVQIATESAVAVHGDLDGSGASNVFLYCLDGSTLRRGKAPDGDASAYWCPATEILAENVTNLRFDYFDANHASIPSSPGATFALDTEVPGSVPDLSDVTQRGAVRRVVITMEFAEEVPGLGSKTYSVGSEVKFRNVR